MSNYYKENAWWTSIYNEIPEVREGMDIADHVEIHDATLRDGEQTAGIVFSVDDKVRIAEKLAEVGVERIEAGMPAVSADDHRAVKEICKRDLGAKIYTFARAMIKDIDMAVDCGAQGVVIEVPIGYPKLKYQFGWTWEKVLEKSVDCINYAKSQGLHTVYFPYDTTRARPEDLENLLKGIMDSAVPDAVGVVDTMGCALPSAIQYMVRYVKKRTGLPVEVHTHNDFGMGVATELAGICAGASCVHSCVSGLGERTGNAAMEELAVGMKLLLNMPNEYRLDKLKDICGLVSDITGIPIPRNKPVTGGYNYTRESGIGIDMVLDRPLVMFATDPQIFGRGSEVVLGKKSGKASIEHYLDKHGLEASEEKVAELLARVKSFGQEHKRLLTDGEFLEIFARCQ